jgi:hypothetical protein
VFKSREERERAQAAKDAERHQAHAAMMADLRAAVEAGARGDIRAEEEAIQRGARKTEFNAELERLVTAGEVRRGEYLGFVGPFIFWSDRILTGDRSVVLMDGDAKASVETAGSLAVTQRPTLTRMAVGSLLPGSALIPGFAFQKKQTHDSRQLFFIVEHPEWSIFQEVGPELEAVVREVAVSINRAASQLSRNTPAIAANQADDPLERLRKLGELRDSGVITDEEFEKKKAELLEQV